jgi:hypothetical protein
MNVTDLWQFDPGYRNGNTPTDDAKWYFIKKYRDELLVQSLWVQLPDAILSPTEKTAWQTYRETLHELEFVFVSPDLVVFPDLPTTTSTPQTPAIVSARARLKAAQVSAKAIPNWATWTQADWEAYFTANLSPAQVTTVTTIALARTMLNRQNLVIQNLVKLVIALRDAQFPDL